jgi:hypothetical protein
MESPSSGVGSPNTMLRPSLRDLDQLVEPLTEAESQVARALSRLADGWTVYVQPRIGLDRPDFVAIHDRYGVCAIEVKTWLPHAVRKNDAGQFELSSEANGWTPTSQQPRFEASRYRSTLFDQFFAMPEDGGSPNSDVRAVVILPYFTTDQATHLFERPSISEGEQLIGVWGGDMLERIDEVVRGLGCQPPFPPSITRLREHIVASERISMHESERAPLSAGVLDIATNPRSLRARRVRGAVGSGKSFALAARAAHLAAEGKEVLLLSFNVTLPNRLREMATERCHEIGANPTRITCSNFHTFCTRVVQDAEVAGHVLQSPPGAPWTVAIVAKVEQAFDQGFRQQYDAVLIDEGQDYQRAWWDLLRSRVVAPDGEILVVADPTQDVYGRFEWTADDTIAGAGFSGDWTDLAGSFRLPDDIAPWINDFAAEHLEGEVLRAMPAPDELGLTTGGASSTSVRRWTNVERVSDLGRAVGLEVVRVLRENPTLRPGDVAFLCDYHHDGVAAVRVIQEAGIPVHHIFSRDPDAPRRRRKHRFWPGAAAVKGCTVHSFKGWEAPAIVLGIGADERAKRIAYLAMTRLHAPADGRPAVISVLNADKRLAHSGTAFQAGSAAPATELRPAPPTPVAVSAPAPDQPLVSPTPLAPRAPAAVMSAPAAAAMAAPAPTAMAAPAPAAMAAPAPTAMPAPAPAAMAAPAPTAMAAPAPAAMAAPAPTVMPAPAPTAMPAPAVSAAPTPASPEPFAAPPGSTPAPQAAAPSAGFAPPSMPAPTQWSAPQSQPVG